MDYFKSIRFSGSERRSSVKTPSETLEERLDIYQQKRRSRPPSAISRDKVCPEGIGRADAFFADIVRGVP